VWQTREKSLLKNNNLIRIIVELNRNGKLLRKSVEARRHTISKDVRVPPLTPFRNLDLDAQHSTLVYQGSQY
jgi:hypothetical protein